MPGQAPFRVSQAVVRGVINAGLMARENSPMTAE